MLIVHSFEVDDEADDGARHRGEHPRSVGSFASLLAAIEEPQIVPRPRTLSASTGGAIAVLSAGMAASAPDQQIQAY